MTMPRLIAAAAASVLAAAAFPVVVPAAPAPAEAGGIPPTPVTISISDEGEGGYAIRHFPSRLRLYTFDRDTRGASSCYGGCAAAWPPVRSEPGDQPVGDWTLVPRSDGAAQWAWRGKPVYIHYHDQPQSPNGDGADGLWHLIPNIPRAK